MGIHHLLRNQFDSVWLARLKRERLFKQKFKQTSKKRQRYERWEKVA